MTNNKNFFEDTNCLLCGSANYVAAETILWRETEMHFVICAQCGLKYMRPRPTRQWYAEFYKKEFWEDKLNDRTFTLVPFKSVDSVDLATKQILEKLRRRAERIHSHISPTVALSSTSLVLELGTAWGENLGLLRRLYGCRILGVEPSELVRTYAAETHGIQFVGWYVEDMLSQQPFDGQVDLIILSHVLENTIDPLSVLQSVRRLLKPTGYLYIDTPNFYYHWNAANPYHPYIFSPETLESLLGRAGFFIVNRFSEASPRVVQKTPTNIYLSVTAQPGLVVSKTLKVDAEQLLLDWHLGMQLIGFQWVQEKY